MNDYLAKPVKLESLASILKKWVPADAPSLMESTPSSPAAPGTQVPVLDQELLETWRSLANGSNEDFLAEIIDLFLVNTPKIMEEIQQAGEQKDFVKLRALAHKMKGSSANLGACRLAMVCSHLEAEATGTDGTGAEPSIRPMLSLLQSEFDLVSHRLRQFPAREMAPYR